MLIDIVDISDIEKRLNFKVTKTVVDSVFDDIAAEIQPHATIPGFRKGTASKEIVKNHYKTVIKTEASARMVHDEVVSAIRDHNLKILNNPTVVDEHRATGSRQFVGEFNLDGSFSASVIADFEPKLTVQGLEELTISEALPSVNDLVDRDLNAIRSNLAKMESVERPIEATDQVKLELLDGDSSNTVVNMSEPQLFLSNEPLLGKKVGDTVKLDMAGGMQMEGKVVSVLSRQMPEIDDELAKAASFKSLAEMKRELGQKKYSEFFAPLRAKLYSEILDTLISKNPFPIPDRWITAELGNILQRLGLKEMPKEEVQKSLREMAERNIRNNIILDAIYRDTESIHLSVDEAYGIIEREAARNGQQTEDFLTYIRNSNQYELVMSFHERNRVVDHLINKANVRST